MSNSTIRKIVSAFLVLYVLGCLIAGIIALRSHYYASYDEAFVDSIFMNTIFTGLGIGLLIMMFLPIVLIIIGNFIYFIYNVVIYKINKGAHFEVIKEHIDSSILLYTSLFIIYGICDNPWSRYKFYDAYEYIYNFYWGLSTGLVYSIIVGASIVIIYGIYCFITE